MRPVAQPKPGAVIDGTQYKKKRDGEKATNNYTTRHAANITDISPASLQLYKVWSKGLSTPHQIHLCK